MTGHINSIKRFYVFGFYFLKLFLVRLSCYRTSLKFLSYFLGGEITLLPFAPPLSTYGDISAFCPGTLNRRNKTFFTIHEDELKLKKLIRK